MKTLKLDHELAELIRQGAKHSTWRINDDKDLSVNDQVELIDKVDPKVRSTWVSFGQAIIDKVVMKRLGDVSPEDFDGHETYGSNEEMYSAYRRYYGPLVGPDTAVKIIDFSFQAYKHDKTPNQSEIFNVIKEVKMYGDGGSRGNPGPSASGFVIMDMNGQILYEAGVYLGVTTNNQAEYQALKFGLEQAKKLGAREVHAHMDSLLVINQMKGIFKVKNRDLWPIYEAVKTLCDDFAKVTFTHVPREFNKLADAEVNKCLDAQTP